MVTAAELNVVGGIGGRVSAIRGGWSTAERERRRDGRKSWPPSLACWMQTKKT
jgi:hypothetical protein